MRRRFTKFVATLAVLFSTTLALTGQTPQVSTTGNDVWYFIQCSPRDVAKPTAKWLTGAADGGELSVAEFTSTDVQRWKVVAMGEGFALINKATGTYMNTDQVWTGAVATSLLYASTAAPTTAVKFVPSLLLTNGVNIVDVGTVVAANNTIDAATMKFSFYSAGSSINKPISYNAINIHSSVKFMQEKDFLKEAIATVQGALTGSSVGNNPGQFSEESINGMTDVLEAYKAIYEDPTTTAENFIKSANELLAVYEEFKTQIILPLLSTNVDQWYFIQGTRPANSYVTSMGVGKQPLSKPVIPDDTQLWKLVSNPNGGFAIQNKVTMEYINTDLESNTIITTQPNMPANGLRFIASDINTNKTVRFWVENIEGSTPAYRLHAGGSGHNWGLMTWTGDRYDNSSWLFMSYVEALKLNLKLELENTRAQYDASVEGSIIGQYSKESRDALFAVIDRVDKLNLDDLTAEDVIENTNALKEAAANFVCNTDVTTLESATPHLTDRWFRIVNAATADYAKNKAMSSNGRELTQKFTFETIDTASDAQLFRFELNEAKTAVRAIANKANKYYLGANGAIVETPTVGVEFAISALDNFSFWIVPTGFAPIHAAQSGTEILNWNSGAGSASAWKFEYVKEESNVVLLDNARSVVVLSSDAAKGSAVITGTTNTSVTTNVQKVSVTAIPNNGVFFIGWTNAAGDTISKLNPFVYTGAESIELKANFVNGYYRDMTRFYVAASPAIQQADRYLTSAEVIVGANTQTLFSGITTNPNPIDAAVTSGQVIGDALINARTPQIVIPLGTDSFLLKCVGRNSEETVENLQWTQQITFVDWNQDFDFVDANEISTKSNVDYDTTLISTEGYVRSIQLPTGLQEGYYRMRVIYNEPASFEEAWGTTIWMNNRIRNGVGYEFEIKYGNPTGTVNPVAEGLVVRVQNSIITIDGHENFELYNLTGQRLNTRSQLSTGVYIVKAGSKIQKVLVK
jgi:hypothetical protein